MPHNKLARSAERRVGRVRARRRSGGRVRGSGLQVGAPAAETSPAARRAGNAFARVAAFASTGAGRFAEASADRFPGTGVGRFAEASFGKLAEASFAPRLALGRPSAAVL